MMIVTMQVKKMIFMDFLVCLLHLDLMERLSWNFSVVLFILDYMFTSLIAEAK